MKYDVIVIGAGLSGLSAAALLAKRGLSVCVAEQAGKPGGSCGIFKRKDVIFDQGAAMLYGFGEHGFNAHRFLFNCLQESFHVIKHNVLYTVNYNGKTIRFWQDVNQFITELSSVFPNQKKEINKFYSDMHKLYNHVISETPSYTTPDETNPEESLRNILKHPFSYLKFLSFMNISTEKLLKKYFNDPEILLFFNKLTSTYCYASISEAPAIMSAVMFIDNHAGGSFYPAGSTLFLPGKLEKVIEENNGNMLYNSEVCSLIFENNQPCGIKFSDGKPIYGRNIIYSGTVWDLYSKIIPDEFTTAEEKNWAESQLPTYSSAVLYAVVEKSAIPDDSCPIEMLSSHSEHADENEITVYIMSMADKSLCPENHHVIVAIGPDFQHWDPSDQSSYQIKKQNKTNQMICVLEKKFPDIRDKIIYKELATPETIKRYTFKRDGAAAGPKQMIGQHMFHRLPIRTKWSSLYCCGESTTMGTGTPTVTTSAIAAANAILKKHKLKPYVWAPDMKNYVTVIDSSVKKYWQYDYYPSREADLMIKASMCRYCSHPACCPSEQLDIASIMRRISCGNFKGAINEIMKTELAFSNSFTSYCEEKCIRKRDKSEPVPITEIFSTLIKYF